MENSKLLGEAKISKLLFQFSIPCVTALLISAFYNIVDQIFIGNSSLGYLGNAATGISFPIIKRYMGEKTHGFNREDDSPFYTICL